MTRATLSELVNGRRGISPEMAVRLSKVFGGSAESWLTQQIHYDLAQIPAGRLRLKHLELGLRVVEREEVLLPNKLKLVPQRQIKKLRRPMWNKL